MEQRLTVSENKIFRKIFGAKRSEEWKKLRNVELHALHSSPDIIKNIKSRHLRWAGWLFNDAVSTTRLFSVDEIGDSEMIFGEMRPRIRHRLTCINITVGENLGKNPTRGVGRKGGGEAKTVYNSAPALPTTIARDHDDISADPWAKVTFLLRFEGISNDAE
ncbi:hypothetical protein ANN_12869 [Periplaneta americana]|uniref:Uncharacterized protein n=1 Tax=Periplaneta americana TaxID=6978 RepID=A0ABQ8TJS9_PERAM|nr:hypothetical protein ANN_12869 [Periplaneta americana]